MRCRARRCLVYSVALLMLAVFSLVLPFGASAAGPDGWTWVYQNPLPSGHQLNATSAGSATAVWSVGDYGTILFWNGTTLTEQASNTTNNLYGVSALDANNVWAVGEAGTILTTTNGGTTWTRVSPSPTSYDLLSVTAAATNSVWAAGGYDGFNDSVIVYYNGTTWSRQLEQATGGFTDIFALNTNQVWAVSGWTWYTSNGGATWTMINDGSVDAPYQVSAVATNNVYAIAWDGTILRSTSAIGGTTWTRLLSGQDWPAGLYALNATHIYFVGWNGTIRMYNGTTWTNHTSGTTNDIYDVDATATNRVFSCGDQKFLTNTGTTAWTTRAGGITSVLYSVSSYDADHVWAVGSNVASGGNIYYSSNGGALWTSQTSGTTATLRAVTAVDATHVWAAGLGGVIRLYGGSTWGAQTSNTTRNLYGLAAANTSSVWAAGDRVIQRYNGTSWSNSLTLGSGIFYGISAADANHIWAVGTTGMIYFWNGSSWATQNGNTTQNFYHCWAYDSNNVWAVGAAGTIRYYNGSSWTTQSSPLAEDLNAVSGEDLSHVWAVTATGKIMFFDGTSWTTQTSPTTNQLYEVFCYDASNVWAVGAAGTIIFADPPYIKACAPGYGDPGQTIDVEVVGGYTHFQAATPTLDFGVGVHVVPGSLNVVDNTRILAQVQIDLGAELGPRQVSVMTALESPIPLEGGFVVGSNPTITSAAPTEVVRGWTGDVEVTGSQTAFSPASRPSFGEGVNVNSVTCLDAARVRANITVVGSAVPGSRSVNVLTGGQTPAPLAGGFSVQPPPVVTSLSASGGPPGSTVTVTGTGFGNTPSDGSGALSTVKFNGIAAGTSNWADTSIKCSVPLGAGIGPVTVTTASGVSNTDKVFGATAPTWYLPEGSTAWGFDTDIAMINPNSRDVTVRVTYLTNSGPVRRPDIKMAPNSRTTINPVNEDNLIGADFSTQVECLEGRTIAVDRTMSWKGPGAAAAEGHSSIGVQGPASSWYLPEGSSAWNFECWLLLMNPSATDADCAVTYMIEGQGPVTVHKSVKARSRATFNIADDIGTADASIMVNSGVGVIAERAMYRNGRREGHDSIGVTGPSNDFYLAEGTTAWGFTTYVLVQNPNTEPAEVSVTYMTPSGEVKQPPFVMPANSRKTIRVNDAVPSTDVSTKVHGSVPIVAERSMYWESAAGEACHDSIGVAAPQPTWYLADGRSGRGFERTFETWTLVQNPSDADVEIRVTYVTYDGLENQAFTDTIPARSRRTYNMAELIKDDRAGIIVQSLSGGRIIVERSMYWDNRKAGTCTIAQ